MLKVAFTHSYFYPLDEKQWKNKTPFPPLGTSYAASFLRESKYSVSLYDTCLLNTTDGLKPFLDKECPDVFVIYDDGFNYLTKMCLTTMREAAFEMIKMAKCKDSVVIVCSSDATDHYEKYLHAGADYVIQGEGEVTLKELVDAIRDKQEAKDLNGIVYKTAHNEIVKNPKRPVYKNLDDFPLPAWDLVDIQSYKKWNR